MTRYFPDNAGASATPNVRGTLYGYTEDTNTSVSLGRMSNAGSANWATAIGESSLASTNSISVGYNAQAENEQSVSLGRSSSTAGSGSIAIGYSASTSTALNSIVVGRNATTSSNNTIVLGNNSHTSLRCNVTSISTLSDERDKTNVQPLNVGLDFVNTLNPVTFDWARRDGSMDGVSDFGFVAQEVAASEDAIDAHGVLGLTDRQDEEQMLLAYGKLVPILVQAIKDLSTEIDDLKNNIK